MHARRLTRLIDRLSMVGHPATEAVLERGVRAGTRSLGFAVGYVACLLSPGIPLHRLGESFDEGLESSRAAPPPHGQVLRFPGQG